MPKNPDIRTVHHEPFKNPKIGGQEALDAIGEMAKAMYDSRPEFDPELVEEHGLAPETKEEEEVIPSMPKRKIQVDAKTVTEPIYTWAFRSTQARGGTFINYITQLNHDEVLSCNCPGWIFSKGEKKDKTCKHTKQVSSEVKDILKKFKAGEELPVIDQTEGGTGPSQAHQAAAVENRLGKDSKIRYGRVIEI